MAHYMCRFVDDAGLIRGELPIIGSSVGDATNMARTLFKRRHESGGFELWFESQCVSKETPQPGDKPDDRASRLDGMTMAGTRDLFR